MATPAEVTPSALSDPELRFVRERRPSGMPQRDIQMGNKHGCYCGETAKVPATDKVFGPRMVLPSVTSLTRSSLPENDPSAAVVSIRCKDPALLHREP